MQGLITHGSRAIVAYALSSDAEAKDQVAQEYGGVVETASPARNCAQCTR